MPDKQTIIFKNPPIIVGTFTVAGPKEKKGVFGKHFHLTLDNDLFGEDSFEKAECKMMETAIARAIEDANKKDGDIDLLLGGDLLNQTVSSSFSARKFAIPYVGVYGACSTMAEEFALASCLISGGSHKTIAVATGSHFSSAERQYRFPLELGNQRPPTSQWTTTGTACAILEDGAGKHGVKITSATFGKVLDFGVLDVNNMGAAMAPAAFDTLKAHLYNTKTTPDDYDLIVTGDLGKMGQEILIDLCERDGIKLKNNYCDCGQMLFTNQQSTFMGASGCGCSAIIVNSVIYDRLKKGQYKKVLYMATGALLSLVTSQQGESIPGIAHIVVLENC